MPSKSRLSLTTFQDPTGSGTVYKTVNRSASNWVLKNGKPDLSVHNVHDAYKASSRIVAGGIPYCYEQLYVGGAPLNPLWSSIGTPSWESQVDSITQVALAKYLGRLRKGQASLGVTFASWRQSAQMIGKRLLTVLDWLKRLTRRALVSKKRGESVAGMHLENIFGWQPLIGDIAASLGIIAGDRLPLVSCKGVHQGILMHARPLTSGGEGVVRVSEYHHGDVRVTVAASLLVTNPNTHLLNRLGLLNPLGVIWDIIPWSFLVGMFVNVNTMLQSLTDYVGLTIKGCSTTTTVHWSLNTYKEMTITGRGGTGWGSNATVCSHKYREKKLPTLAFQVKVPSFNLSTLTMLGALVVQRFTKLDKILSLKTS